LRLDTSANNFARHLQSGVKRNEFSSTLTAQWGFTDRLEGDLILGYGHARETASGLTPETNRGVVDTVLGIRYRFLEENRWPLTLTMGPQVTIPTGNANQDMGTGNPGFAWDVTLGKEWNKYFFNYGSLNYSLTPPIGGKKSRSSS
jgi:Putative MetA-pathway of phenol degradation